MLIRKGKGKGVLGPGSSALMGLRGSGERPDRYPWECAKVLIQGEYFPDAVLSHQDSVVKVVKDVAFKPWSFGQAI